MTPRKRVEQASKPGEDDPTFTDFYEWLKDHVKHLFFGEARTPRDTRTVSHLSSRLFPMMFTLLCIATYVIPVWLLSTYIGRDYQVYHFISKDLHYVLGLLVLFAVVHIMHLIKGAPIMPLIVTCFFFTGMTLLCTGAYVSTHAGKLSDELQSEVMCVQTPWSLAVEIDWQFARTFYITCMGATANETEGMDFEAALNRYRMPYCSRYSMLAGLVKDKDYGAKYPAWEYLAETETKLKCSGWCAANSQPLWTFDQTIDSCAVSVGNQFRYKIQPAANQVVFYTSMVMIAFPILFRKAGPVLKAFGMCED